MRKILLLLLLAFTCSVFTSEAGTVRLSGSKIVAVKHLKKHKKHRKHHKKKHRKHVIIHPKKKAEASGLAHA